MEAERLSYSGLDRRAGGIAVALAAFASSGERALLLYPPGLDFIAALLACFYAGIVAVPAYPPRPRRDDARLRAILEDAEPSLVLTTSGLLSSIKRLVAHAPRLAALRWLATDTLPEEDWMGAPTLPDSPAFLQYTSGSTGSPKGVIVTHANLLHNERSIQAAFGQHEGSVVVGWLPLYHDMGLIGNVLQPLFSGGSCILMSPVAFLQRPRRWLEAISRYQATTSGGPNFAFDLCVDKVGEAERSGLDLSSWTVAFNGSEPVRAATLERFAAAFAPCGFRPEAFYPCYGLAEATLFVTGPALGLPVRTVEQEARSLVSCGGTWGGQDVAIVHPETLEEVGAGSEGEIWVSGPSVAQGYWNRPEATEATFHARLTGAGDQAFLRTGDLGFLRDGQLFVTGRLKDLIIVRGQNHYPQDLELTVQGSHPALRGGAGAAFAVDSEHGEGVVVVQETDPRRPADWEGALAAARSAISEEHGLALEALLLVRPGAVPRTTSGKVQRQLCRSRFLEGSFKPLAAWRPAAAHDEPGLPELPSAATVPEITAWLQGLMAHRLGLAAGRLDTAESLLRHGLDSLAAVELSHEIEAVMRIELPLATLLEGPSIDDLAAQLHARSGSHSVALPARAAREDDEVPLSPGQRALWFLQRLDPAGPAYNIAGAARLLGAFDVGALRRAIQGLVDRHSALRTTFSAREGEPFQRVKDRIEASFEELDATGWSAADVAARLDEEVFRPFDIEKGPLLRISLFEGAPGSAVLLLAIHHLVADFWSLAVLLRELGILYAAAKDDAPVPLAPLALAYADYARWQAEIWRERGGDERHWGYWNGWREDLGEEWPVLLLPNDRPRPVRSSQRAVDWAFRLGEPVTTGLRAIARVGGATLFNVLLATFQMLLHRIGGQRHLLLGSPSAGRSRKALSSLVGYFVNPLVLGSDAEGDPPVTAFLERSRRKVLEAFEHEVPFPLLVERLQPEREMGRPPLLQAVFVLQRSPFPGQEALAAFALGEPGGRLDLGGLTLESMALTSRPGQFDLTLLAGELDGEIRLSLVHDMDLFDQVTIGRMAGHFGHLAAAIAADPQRRLSELPLLSEGELWQVLGEWNDTAWPASNTGLLHERVAAQALRDPEAPAVICGSSLMTRRELTRRANRLARHLRSLGVGPEATVGVLCERRPEAIVGLLAVLAAGGAYLPIDPATPRERVIWLLRDCRARVLLTGERPEEDALDAGIPVISLATATGTASEDDEGLPGSGVFGENLAYVIYTSGSTGRPKGVEISHASLSHLVDWHLEVFGLTPEDAVSHVASPSFDASVWEIWPALAAGACLHLPDEEARTSPEALRDWLAAERISAAFVPTAMAERLLTLDPPPGPPLRLVLTGGDRLRIIPSGLSFSLYNNYGPTEGTVVTTSGVVAQDGATGRAPSLGRPIADVRVYLLDGQLRPVPRGSVGELYLGGAGLARGYLGQPGLTAEKFLPDPFGGPGGRLYRTGDRARWLPQGELDFAGRTDDQVKVRGFRIEPAEIEAALALLPGVREAAVLAREDPRRGLDLVAFVAGTEMAPTSDFRRLLRAMLPSYMIPTAFEALEALPLTANGKVDRRALAARVVTRGAPEREGEPRGPVEELIAGLWAEALGLERVGIHDDFFALGGHSLLAARLVSQIRKTLGSGLTLRSFLGAPTVAGIAVSVEEDLDGAGAVAAALRPVPRVPPPPLSSAQRRLWLLDRLRPGNPAYNIPLVLRLLGRLDAPALAKALDGLCERHEALRTTFPEMGGEPVQRIACAAVSPPVRIDLTSLGPTGSPLEAARIAAAEACRPFDLTNGPLLRATLLRLAAEEHRLLLTVHHIVADGWSVEVLLRDLAALYAAAASGCGAALPELSVQPADVAAWEATRLENDRFAARLGWWERRLTGAPQLRFPADRPRSAVRSSSGRTAVLELTPDLAAASSAFARRESATPFMVLLAVFQTLLFRATGEVDLVLGSPVAHRERAELEPLVGLLLETLVLRTAMAGDLTFRALLERSRKGVLDAIRHADVPLEKIVEHLRPERSVGDNPLFEVTFNLQPAVPDRLVLPGLEIEAWGSETGTAKFELGLSFQAGPDRLTARLEHSSDLFDTATAARMLHHFAHLLSSAVADPTLRLEALPLLGEAERFQLLTEWNEQPSEPASGPALHEVFAERAARTPDAPAVACDEESLTYGELAARAAGLARFLTTLGAGPGARVGVWAERSVGTIVGILAALEAGAAYIPLDPSYPAERLSFMARHSGLTALLARGDLVPSLPDLGVEVVSLDRATTGGSPGARLPRAPAESPAYVLYTSGSTGQPKGVSCHHAGVLALLRDMDLRQPIRPGAVCSLFSSFSFDVSVYEIFSALLAGGRLEIVPDGVRADGRALAGWLAEHAVESAYVPPTLLGEVVRELARVPAPLRRLLVGVEPIQEPLLAALAASNPGLRILNGYGPTEATVCVTLYEVGSRPVRERVTPIGRPVRGARVYLLDSGLEPVPVGVPGELYAAGVGLAQGYLAEPKRTAERFLPDPFHPAPGERMYRTGDLARWLPEGDLEFLGRLDFQVKIRGIRVEPGETEAVLREHPEVRQAVVVADQGPAGDVRLVAYVVAPGLAPGTLRTALRERLPEILVPSALVFLDALPLTANGKVDRRALPKPGAQVSVTNTTSPRTPAEAALATIWAEVLGVETVGIHDNFFDLGGHSLQAARLVARLRDTLRVEVPLGSVFAAPTVASLADLLAGYSSGGGDLPGRIVPRSGETAAFPLSFGQQQLWILERIEPGTPLFHLPAALDCHGRFDPAAFERSLGEILRRHEILRTRFAFAGGRPVQIPWPPSELPAESLLPRIDLSGLPEREHAAELARRTAAEVCRPFDLERGPLMRAALLRLGPESHRVVLTMHHIAADAWSIGLLIRELGQLYTAFAGGQPSPLPELSLQYADFAAWQRERLRGERLDESLGYWTELLAPKAPGLDLPTDRPRPPVQGHRGARRPIRLEEAVTDGVRRLGGTAGATLFMALLTVFQALLERHSGQEDLAVGTAVADRPDPALEGVIGLFLNTLVLRSDLSGDPTFRELLGRVRGVVLGALAHAELPFERLVEALQPERDLSRSPLFQVFFALRNEPLPTLALPSLTISPADTFPGATQFDLSLHLEESQGGLAGWIEYDRALFDGATVERLALHYGILLAGGVAAPDRRLSALPLLSEPERSQLLVQWNDTRSTSPGAVACIHEIFRAQVERTPDVVAAIHGDAALTYRELDDRASHLAHRLVRSGVQPGDRVGVCIERSLPMLSALLGVLKAGAAYVPLDPTYPQARLAAMLEDSQAAALIASPTAGVILEHGRMLAPEAEDDVAGERPGRRLPELPAEAAAYVIYTSGSTGRPKGVVVSHRNVAFFFTAMDAELRPEEPGVWLAVTSICFDISVLELLWTLTRGFRVVIYDGQRAGEGASVAEQIARHGVSHLQCTPSMARMLAASPERLQGLAPLSRLLLGGEALPAPLADRLCDTVSGEVRNLYGPTETTVWSLGQRVGSGEARPPIGRPLANTEVYVLDALLRPVPLGAPGGVFLGGEGVAAGYWGRPDLTAERFLPDPLGSRPGGRLYRTGDLARHHPDGRLDFVGRSDHQVKVRGVRIELGEIEAELRAHPAVAEAVAVVREDAPGDRRLIAYLVPAAGNADRGLATGELRRYLAGRLPEAMIPTVFVALAALPLTQNGKVDRGALPAPETGRPHLDSTYAAPRTPGERTLAAVWQEVLGHERVGIHDNFFELGGNSLLLVEIESRLRDAFGREIPIVQMFRNPTIHGLARALAAHDREPAGAGEAPPPGAGEAPAQGNALARQRQFLEEMKRRRAQQRRPGS